MSARGTIQILRQSMASSIIGQERVVALPAQTVVEAYTRSGFSSIWNRAMDRFEKAGGEKFHEHDLRAVTADEAETLEHAQHLLGHRDPKTTTIYRGRARRRVKVLSHKGTDL
ncbi:MAG: hypothetical protein O7G86_13595 [Gammaproteobacteria bacterium]|nr:hypothetical protein [Gammaproteobacteria bacterium]